MIARISGLTDEGLANLRANAIRLAHTGSQKQQKAANDMLPAIHAEITTRLSKKVESERTARLHRKKVVTPKKKTVSSDH